MEENSRLVNCEPLSVLIESGTPCLAIQDNMRAFIIDSVRMSCKGIASGYLLYLSITVSRYVYPLLSGKGPTRSMWIDENFGP